MPNLRDARADRFAAYVERLAGVLGHRDRHEPLRAYVTGLCLPGERKSIEPMAARVDPRHVRARHQSMHHFIAEAPWDAAAVLRVARDWVLGPMVRHGAGGRVDRGRHRVPQEGPALGGRGPAVLRRLGQTGQLPSGGECLGGERGGERAGRLSAVPAGGWASDRRRRRAAGVPDAVPFQPKWQIALGQIHAVQAEDVPRAPVVADAGYGDTTAFRDALTAAGLPYVVGVKKETTAWPPGRGPRPPKRWTGRGRPPTLVRRTATHTPPKPQAVGPRAAADGVADGDVAGRHARRDALPLRAAARAARPSR